MPNERAARVAESLLKSAETLGRASTATEVRTAVKDGLLGLEYHLDTLAQELARDPAAPGAFEPAFRGRAEKVEATLRELLVAAWAMLALNDEQLGTLERARALAKQLRAVEHDEVKLVFDQLLAPQGID